MASSNRARHQRLRLEKPWADPIGNRLMLHLLFFALLLYIVLPAASGFGNSLQAVSQAELIYVALAAVCVITNFGVVALTYTLLAFRTVRYLPTLCVQVAGAFVNRILPAGLGGVGINAYYLTKNNHSLPAATAVVTTNNALGFIGNAVLLLIALLIAPRLLPALLLPEGLSPAILAVSLLFIILLLVLITLFRIFKRLRSFIAHTLRYLLAYSRRPHRLAAALLSSMLMTSLHVLAFFMIVQAFGLSLSLAQSLVVVSLGALFSAALPTPGGLGAAEAGLVAGMSAYGIHPEAALPAVLTYRLLTFWMPLLPGFMMLQVVQKRYL